MSEPLPQPSGVPSAAAEPVVPLTRAGALWVAVAAASLLLLLLVVFIAQNMQLVDVHFLGLSGTLALGLALLISAVLGAGVVVIAGTARILQLRRVARRNRDLAPRR